MAENRVEGDIIFDRISDIMAWVLENDDNNVVKHEACYQIAARNMRSKIPTLINSALNDKSGLTKHEALESLGLMRATEAIDLIKSVLEDPNDDVRQTAAFVIKRLDRMKNAGSYEPSKII
jgi:HEAT repeat protein